MRASYYMRRRPPRLSRVALSLTGMWLAVLVPSYFLGKSLGLETRTILIIVVCVMLPGTVLGIVQIAIRWRRYGPPK